MALVALIVSLVALASAVYAIGLIRALTVEHDVTNERVNVLEDNHG